MYPPPPYAPFKPKRRHVRTHGKRAAAAAAKASENISSKLFVGNIANQFQIAQEYEKSFKKLIPLSEKLQASALDEKPWRLADIAITLKREIQRIDYFLEHRAPPSQRMERWGKQIAGFLMELETASAPQPKDSKVVDFIFGRDNNIKYLEFQRQKLLSEQNPFQAKYEKLHRKQEEMLRRNLGIPDFMGTPPRTIEEVEKRIAEIKSLPFQADDGAPMLYKNLTSPALNRNYSKPDESEQRIIRERAKLNPNKPLWDILGTNEQIIATYTNEEEFLVKLKAAQKEHPDWNITGRYRGPQGKIKRLIEEKNPLYTVFNENDEVVKRYRSFIQAKALAYDNRDKGWRVSPDHEVNRKGRKVAI